MRDQLGQARFKVGKMQVGYRFITPIKAEVAESPPAAGETPLPVEPAEAEVRPPPSKR